MISFRCGQCGKDLKVQDELAGKKVRCPGCQKVAAVPQLAASLSPPPGGGGRLPEEKEKTLAWTPGAAEAKGPDQAGQESLANSGEGTAPGVGGKGDGTLALPGRGPSPELYDFLAPAQKPDEIGRLGPYRVLKVLGAGGMGVVFKAEDPGLQRLVALKAMRPALANSASSKERFFREARAAAGLKHPHIVTIFQVGEDRGAPYLAMEFLDGESLDDRLKREAGLPVPEIIRISRQIAEGLAAAHAKGLIHRDIKPANIWLETTHHSPQTNIKILDFGLARALSDETHLTQSGAIVGTPAYMAPEQAEGLPVDHRCDLFSLGCVLYRMCTGHSPFKGATTLAILSALAQKDPPPPVSLNLELPAELSDLVMHLLAKKPDQRPESAQAVVEALQEFEAQTSQRMARPATKTAKGKGAGTTKMEPAVSQRRPSAKKRLPLPWLLGSGVLGLVILGLLLFFLNKNDGSPEKKNAEDLPKTFTNSLGMEFVQVPKGKSWLGGGGGIPGDKEVEIAHDFYLGKYEVTQEEWQKVMGNNPSFYKAVAGVSKEDQKRFPVEQVSWDDCQPFIKRVNEQVKEAGWVYRLPTEVEWEYACRGGPLIDKFESDFDFYFEKPTNTLLPDQANFGHGNGLKRTCKVGSYKPNRLGLYDMHGNVWEWCAGELKEGKGASPPVGRGGGFSHDARHCRLTHRNNTAPSTRSYDIGLRLARVPVGKEIVKVPAEKKKPPVEAKLPSKFKNDLGMEFVLVPKGKSWLGGGGGKPGDKEVEILHDFYLGKYEVTQEEWEKVTGINPSQFKAVPGVSKEDQKGFPVENVSWEDCQVFIKRLNEQTKEAGWVYRLPTEVEWEYACRGGPLKEKFDSAFDFYFEKPTNTLLPDQANFEHGKGLKRTCKVGSYKANRLGLYDMHGNVWEWCENLYDPKDAKRASRRLIRGGDWLHVADVCRAAYRDAYPPSSRYNNLGLRLARVPVGKEIVKVPAEEKKPPVEAKSPATFTNSLDMEFVLVPKGKSWLGGGGGKPGTNEVEIVNDFYLGKYEVTQEEWEKVTGRNPSQFKAVQGVSREDQKRFPVESVTWEDCQVFIVQLNKQVKEAGWVYRLPKEVEWEYACRGGPMQDKSESAFNFYFERPTITLLPEQANYAHDKRLNRTCKVGTYQPNRLGLYDMHGNVWEWCHDELKDDKGAARRLYRGGGWGIDAGHGRAADRETRPPSGPLGRGQDLGMRLARVPVGKEIVKIPAEEKKPPVEAKLPPTFTNDLGIEFVLVPKGKSWLGGGGGKPGTKEVEIKEDFYLGKYEVTQEEWEKVTGSNPSKFKAVPGVAKEDQKRFPVDNVSWEDAQVFIERLNKQVKEAGWVYRLPKDGEWEYACRGGPLADKSESAFDFYCEKPTNQLQPDQANIVGKGRTCKVGSYKPNRLGLHDMRGNVWEWCEGLFDPKDPDPVKASLRVIRGGCWVDGSGNCRTTNRHATAQWVRSHFFGMRLARVPIGKEIVKIPAEEKKPPEFKLPPAFKNDLGMEFVLVPKGKSWLGGGGKAGDKEVEIDRAFYLGKYEVTQMEWEKVMGVNPSAFKAVPVVSKENQKRFPVEMVSWDDCQVFIKRINEQAKDAGWNYRLPTGVEWEYACRGGPLANKLESAFDFYFEKPTNTLLPEQANFDHGKGLKHTCKVGSYKPNRLGLYDMHGNVWEWCQDELKDDKGAPQRLLRAGAAAGGTPPSARHRI